MPVHKAHSNLPGKILVEDIATRTALTVLSLFLNTSG